MKVNVYLCVLDLVDGDYWMSCVIVRKEVIPFMGVLPFMGRELVPSTTHYRRLFYYSFNRYGILFVTSGIFFCLSICTHYFSFRFYCCYNRFINYYFVTFYPFLFTSESSLLCTYSLLLF